MDPSPHKWKELFDSIGYEYHFAEGCNELDLQAAEENLGFVFPEDIRSVLQETNGIYPKDETPLVFPLQDIVKNNQWAHSNSGTAKNYASFDSLLFFGDAGADSIWFARSLDASKNNIVAWSPIGGDREVIASSLEEFFVGWLTGKISV